MDTPQQQTVKQKFWIDTAIFGLVLYMSLVALNFILKQYISQLLPLNYIGWACAIVVAIALWQTRQK